VLLGELILVLFQVTSPAWAAPQELLRARSSADHGNLLRMEGRAGGFTDGGSAGSEVEVSSLWVAARSAATDASCT
jgi:hypothetical protein